MSGKIPSDRVREKEQSPKLREQEKQEFAEQRANERRELSEETQDASQAQETDERAKDES